MSDNLVKAEFAFKIQYGEIYSCVVEERKQNGQLFKIQYGEIYSIQRLLQGSRRKII